MPYALTSHLFLVFISLVSPLYPTSITLQVGEVLDARYEVFACKGKGVFSTVLRARDLARQVISATGQLLPGVGAGPLAPGAEHPEVAIKVSCSCRTCLSNS
jgi:hypothetical protein